MQNLNFSSSKRKRDPNSFYDDPNSCKRPKNDVFINYSFEDTGKSFVSHLLEALELSSFIVSDHTLLPVGQDTRLELLKAIEESEIYVLVFSPNYAYSTSCLDELVDIMDRYHKLDQRKVFPVFFKVEPSHVRSQEGPFMKAFQAHQTNIDPERVKKWKQALTNAGQLSGLPFENRDEAKFVKKIVKELEKMQIPQELHVTDFLVGIESRAEELILKLRLDCEDALVVAVSGISGIGKTTIVKEVYNRIASSFAHSCFLDINNFQNWKVELPKTLISCLTRKSKFSMSNHNEVVTLIIRLVRGKKVLLVLDDVNSFQQLESVGICPQRFGERFGEGSRIIVTTKDKGSLGNIPYASYHTRLLNQRESLNLFTRLMFVRDDPAKTKFIEEIVGHAGGLPLVLKVWSRHFQQYEREQWPSILETLKRIPHGDVQKQLQLSYDSLTNRAKKLFLDLVCFFDNNHQVHRNLVVKVLQDEDLAFFPNIEINYLVDKGLVKEWQHEGDPRLSMHHAIREMGLEIVRQENEDEPGQRTRLSDRRDVMRVLTECSGTESVESISLELFENMKEVTLEAFRKMSNLRLIKIKGDEYSKSIFSQDEMTHLCFKKLKYMSWFKCPFISFDKIDMCNVVVLQVRESKLERLWEGVKSLKKLRILDVSGSLSLTRTGNFSDLENLEELYFTECKNLEELHSSIGCLPKLAILDLRSSIPLKRTPLEMIGKISSLRKLILGSGRSNLDFPLMLEPVEFNDLYLDSLKDSPITELSLYGCNILNISGGIGSLACLKHLYLHQTTFPSHHGSLLGLHELKTIELDNCDSIQSIPNLPGNITSIKAHDCKSLVDLPRNISALKSLTVLDFHGCPELGTEDPHFLMKVTGLTNLTSLIMCKCSVSQVPTEIGNLVSLKELDLADNTFSFLPDSLSNLSRLVLLHLHNCKDLQSLPLLPSNLRTIHVHGCGSLDVISCASIRMKVSKDSLFSIRLKTSHFLWKKLPDWCSYKSGGDVLSLVAPVHLGNICGIIVFSIYRGAFSVPSIPKMYNETKGTSHCLGMTYSGCIMSYPLNDTTLMVEPGDSVLLKFPQEWNSLWGLRLIYESDVVDCKFVF